MRYGSVCSGVEAASLAWEPLGWEPQWFAEIEKFPAAVLNHHWPQVENLGDITDDHFIQRAGAIDVLVGGTPCQSFSVAGLRGGLGDDRGNLALRFCQIVDQLTPTWVVWENVPGVLSSNGGRDFGAILGALVECGYGFAYRILDAQFFGVAQRRRRVFVVGYLGDWRPPAAVLFERYSLLGHTAESAEKRQEAAGDVGGGVEENGPTHTLTKRYDSSEDGCGRGVPLVPTVAGDEAYNLVTVNAREDPIHTSGKDLPLGAKDTGHAVCYPINSMAALRDQGADQNRQTFNIGADGDPSPTLSNQHHHAIAFTQNHGGDVLASPHAPSISTNSNATGRNTAKVCIAFQAVGDRSNPSINTYDVMPPHMHDPGSDRGAAVCQSLTVRRLTPVECERLQGMPDNHTRIPWRNKPAAECPDGPRYKAIGNSMAVPVMRWIGERIDQIDKLLRGSTPVAGGYDDPAKVEKMEQGVTPKGAPSCFEREPPAKGEKREQGVLFC